MRVARSTAISLVTAAVLSAASPVRAVEGDGPDLRPGAWRALGITLGALALDGVLAARWVPTACTICGTDADTAAAGKQVDGLDDRARDALLWRRPQQARRASDLLANVAIPILAAGDAVRSTSTWGNAARDVLVVAESASLSTLTTEVAKNGAARIRPGLPSTAGQGAARYQSFWSGHTELAFSIVVSQAMQDTLRRDRAAPWIWAVGLTLASGVGYLRVAGDAHWLTDVLAGAAVGSAFGVGVPLAEGALVHGVTLSPAPGGVALHF